MRKVQPMKEISQIGPIADKDKQLQTDDFVKAEIMNDYFSSDGKTLAQNFTEQKEHQYNHIYLFIYRFVQCTGERTIGHVVPTWFTM